MKRRIWIFAMVMTLMAAVTITVPAGAAGASGEPVHTAVAKSRPDGDAVVTMDLTLDIPIREDRTYESLWLDVDEGCSMPYDGVFAITYADGTYGDIKSDPQVMDACEYFVNMPVTEKPVEAVTYTYKLDYDPADDSGFRPEQSVAWLMTGIDSEDYGPYAAVFPPLKPVTERDGAPAVHEGQEPVHTAMAVGQNDTAKTAMLHFELYAPKLDGATYTGVYLELPDVATGPIDGLFEVDYEDGTYEAIPVDAAKSAGNDWLVTIPSLSKPVEALTYTYKLEYSFGGKNDSNAAGSETGQELKSVAWLRTAEYLDPLGPYDAPFPGESPMSEEAEAMLRQDAARKALTTIAVSCGVVILVCLVLAIWRYAKVSAKTKAVVNGRAKNARQVAHKRKNKKRKK